MPPKRKATGGAKGKGAKKAKTEEPDTPATMKDAAAKLMAEDKKKGVKKSHKLDSHCNVMSAKVFEDYDCMLNQTDIGHNNNKFYVIQVVEQIFCQYFTWTRWGRVGETGQNALKGPTSKENAIKEFEKKFRDKTKNSWADRANFKPVPGKYTLIEMADADELDAPVVPVPSVSTDGKRIASSKLDSSTQLLMRLIFNEDMFKEAMKKFDIDVKKMPLGKLSKGQIAKGFEVLDEIEKDLKANKKTKLKELSSKFYTVIPHDFGRKIPPVIDNLELLRNKMDMLLVLGDIEIAQSLQKEKDKKMTGKDVVPHPLDVNYSLLNCDLELLDKKSSEFKIIENYTKATSCGWDIKINDVWKVNREGEASRFKAHDKLGNRKLLWHGTNIAVVAAILKGGLRIMPHSGGRLGAGIYFASENNKSACYVGRSGIFGVMFLNEVALGQEFWVQQNQSSFRSAPSGFDSVVGQGRTEPDSNKDITLKFDGKTVTVPQGKPKVSPACTKSRFAQSEYLIYKESQNRIRYLLLMEF